MESFNGKLRYELLNREVFAALLEAKLLSEAGVRNAIRFAHIALRAIGHLLREPLVVPVDPIPT